MKTLKRDRAVKLSNKKRYQSPKLVTYGDLRRLTKVKDGASGDGGGKPMTKSSGANA
jgi:hypothetical protein